MMQMYMDTEALVSVLMRAHLSSRVLCSDGEIARSESEEKRRRIALTASYGLWPLSMPPRARHVGACLSVVAVSVEQTQVSFLLHKSTSIVWRHGHQSSHLFLQSRVWYRLV